MKSEAVLSVAAYSCVGESDRAKVVAAAVSTLLTSSVYWMLTVFKAVFLTTRLLLDTPSGAVSQ